MRERGADSISKHWPLGKFGIAETRRCAPARKGGEQANETSATCAERSEHRKVARLEIRARPMRASRRAVLRIANQGLMLTRPFRFLIPQFRTEKPVPTFSGNALVAKALALVAFPNEAVELAGRMAEVWRGEA